MATTNSSVIGNREDLKQLATIIAAENYPLKSLMPKEPVHNKRPVVLLDELASPSATGHIEGNKTDTGVDKFPSLGEYTGQAQRLVREWAVTKEQESEKSAVPVDAASASEKALRELGRDCELVIAGDQDKTADVPGTTAGVTAGLGALINNTAPTGLTSGFETPTASIYSGTKADFDEEAFNALLISMFGIGGDVKSWYGVFGTTLRSQIVKEFTRNAGTSSKVDYNLEGIGTIPWSVEEYDSYVGNVKIMNGNPACMPSSDRGYILDPQYVSVGEVYGEGSEEYEGRGAGRLGAVDVRFTTLTRGPKGLAKIEFSDEA